MSGGEIAGLIGREWYGSIPERYPYIGCDSCFADKIAVRGKPLGDAEQDG